MIKLCKKNDGSVTKFRINKLAKSIQSVLDSCGTICTSYLTVIVAKVIADQIENDHKKGYIPTVDDISECTEKILYKCGWVHESELYRHRKIMGKLK